MRTSERGFTLVELLIVMVISLIIMAGAIGLVDMAYRNFQAHRNLRAITDASRRSLSTMSRELMTALHIVNPPTGDPNQPSNGTTIQFYGDIDGDNLSAAVDNYTVAEKVTWRLVASVPGTPGYIEQTVVHAVGDPDNPGSSDLVETAVLAQGITALRFKYYSGGVKATSELLPSKHNLDASANLVRIELDMKQGNVVRTVNQDVFLRVLDRVASSCTLVYVDPPSGAQGSTNLEVAIYGRNTHFIDGQTQADFGEGITVTRIDVDNTEKVRVRIDIDSSALRAARTVYVNTGGDTPEYPDPMVNGFRVY